MPLASSSVLVKLSPYMTAANAIAVVINIRLHSCAVNTENVWIGSCIKNLIQYYVKKNPFFFEG